MQSVQPQIDVLIAAPAGRALLLIAARSRLDPAGIATPRKTLAVLALAEVSRWRIDRPAALLQLERADPHLLQSLARVLLTSPGAAWWFAPLERSRQVWLSHDGDPPLAERLASPDGLPSSWERYAQKPANGFFTSTLIDGSSGAKTALTVGTSDFADTFQSGPIACWRLDAAPDARVFEIDGPGAWHALCARYPALGDEGRIVPHWSAVASDFDAVHLTLGGLLTTEQVRIDSPSGWSQHDGWDFEQTLWLHWKFTGRTPAGCAMTFPSASSSTTLMTHSGVPPMTLSFANPSSVHAPLGLYSHTVSVPEGTELLFISGQVGVRPDGTTPPTMAEQAEQVFSNIVALLRVHELGPTDIVKLTTFMVAGQDGDAVRAARLKHLGSHRPASTAVFVAGLVDPAWVVEVEAIAAKRRGVRNSAA